MSDGMTRNGSAAAKGIAPLVIKETPSTAADQLAIFGHAMRNRDSVAEVGVGLEFAPEHALNVAGRDVAAIDQYAASLTDRVFFIRGTGV